MLQKLGERDLETEGWRRSKLGFRETTRWIYRQWNARHRRHSGDGGRDASVLWKHEWGTNLSAPSGRGRGRDQDDDVVSQRHSAAVHNGDRDVSYDGTLSVEGRKKSVSSFLRGRSGMAGWAGYWARQGGLRPGKLLLFFLLLSFSYFCFVFWISSLIFNLFCRDFKFMTSSTI
jgi:hypothetical protein